MRIRMCPPGTLSYRVRRGDTLGAVAERYGVPVAELASANGMKQTDALREGQVLCVAQKRCRSGRVHTLRKGDTLQGVAKMYRITLSELLRANPFLDPNHYLPGQPVCIPDSTHFRENCIKYRVARGETVMDILNRLRIPLSVLQQYNPEVEIARLSEGQVIAVPESLPGRRCPYGIYYIVKDGDTLSSIARECNVSTVELLNTNRGLVPRDFTVGRMICLPRARSGK